MLIALHNSLSSHQVLGPTAHQIVDDFLFVEVRIGYSKKLIAAAYISSSQHTQSYKDFTKCLEELSTGYSKDEIIMCGDVNLTHIRWHSTPSNFTPLQYINPHLSESAEVIQQTAAILWSGLNNVPNIGTKDIHWICSSHPLIRAVGWS